MQSFKIDNTKTRSLYVITSYNSRLNHKVFFFHFTLKVLRKYLTGGFCGHAIDGSPLRVELFGKLDIKGLMFSTKKSDLEKTKLLQCESTIKDWAEQSKKVNHYNH